MKEHTHTHSEKLTLTLLRRSLCSCLIYLHSCKATSLREFESLGGTRGEKAKVTSAALGRSVKGQAFRSPGCVNHINTQTQTLPLRNPLWRSRRSGHTQTRFHKSVQTRKCCCTPWISIRSYHLGSVMDVGVAGKEPDRPQSPSERVFKQKYDFYPVNNLIFQTSWTQFRTQVSCQIFEVWSQTGDNPDNAVGGYFLRLSPETQETRNSCFHRPSSDDYQQTDMFV